MASADIDYGYGYEEAKPFGYEAAADKLGYGSPAAAPNQDDLGYGYGDDAAAGEQPPRRERTRRRCSITKYSLDAQEEVKVMFQEESPEEGGRESPAEEADSMEMANEEEEEEGKRPGAPKRTKSGKMKFWKRRNLSRTKTM